MSEYLHVEKPFLDQLAALAWRIWSAGGTPSLVEDAAIRAGLYPALCDGVLLEDENGLQFVSEPSMVQAATQYVLQAEVTLLSSTPKACYKRLHEIWREEIGKEDKVSGHVLAILHNTGHLDAYSWGQQAIENGIRVFDVLHVLEGAVTHFQDACSESIFKFFTGHYESVKNDLMGGLVYPKLQSWFTQHPDVASEVKRLHEKHPEERSGSIYGCSLHGLILNDFRSGFALTLAASSSLDPLIAGPAVHVLGLADYSHSSCRAALDETIRVCSGITRTLGHPLLGTAARTLSRLVLLDENVIACLLDEIGKTAVPEALYSLSDFLWREEKTIEEKDWFWPLLLNLTAAKTEHKGILDNVDMMLTNWMKDPVKKQRAKEFMNIWISSQPNDAFNDGGLEQYFSSTVHQLAEQQADLNFMLTEWLLNNDSRYPMIAQKLISHLRVSGLTSLELDSTIIDKLSQDDIRFLLRRILGYIVGDELQIGLVFSLVRTRDAKKRTFGYISSVLQDHVGYDYPYQTIEFLKTRQNAKNEKKAVKALCKQISFELQRYLDELGALPDLKEFHPSSMKMRRFAKERQRQMNESMEEASKDSIWRQIATHIPLKAGRRMFQTINGQYTAPTELNEMSHSVALPKSEITDPAGAARERVLFRRSKRGSQ